MTATTHPPHSLCLVKTDTRFRRREGSERPLFGDLIYIVQVGVVPCTLFSNLALLIIVPSCIFHVCFSLGLHASLVLIDNSVYLCCLPHLLCFPFSASRRTVDFIPHLMAFSVSSLKSELPHTTERTK